MDEEEVSAGWMAGDTGAHVPGAVTSGDGDEACSITGACSTRSTGGVSDCRGGSSSDSMAGWLGGDGDGDGNGGSRGEGGEQHPWICRICLFLAKTAARLLARVASL